jgi:hypothetical protein
MYFILLSMFISYIIVNSKWGRTRLNISEKNKIVCYITIAILIYGLITIIRNKNNESFSLLALPNTGGYQTNKSLLDPNKFYEVGTLIKSNTVTPSQNGGANCVEFPIEIYRDAPIKPAQCVGGVAGTTAADPIASNDASFYNWSSQGIWGMAIRNVFVSDRVWPWTEKGVVIYLRNKFRPRKYLVWSTTTTCASDNVAACLPSSSAAVASSRPFYFQIPDADLDVRGTGLWLCIVEGGRQLIKPWAGSVASSTLCLRPAFSACAANNVELTINSVMDKDCSPAAGGTTYASPATNRPSDWASWTASVAAGGVFISQRQSNFPIHPSGGDAGSLDSDKIFPVLFNDRTNTQATFEWRYSEVQP